MLVLTRKQSEMIQIGDNIVIKILYMDRKTVRIGIEAPTDVRVLRSELCFERSASTLATLLRRRRALRVDRAAEVALPTEVAAVATH